MILIQITTALAVGAYVVLSRDAHPKRHGVAPRESIQHPADHLDRDGRPELAMIRDCILLNDNESSRRPQRGMTQFALSPWP
jgi:hypothetical protein